MGIKIALTPSQRRELQTLFDIATVAGDEGKPGVVIAQVFPDGMHVGFIRHDISQKIIPLLKSDADTSRCCRSVLDVGDKLAVVKRP